SLRSLVDSKSISNDAKIKQLKGILRLKLTVIKRSVEYALRGELPTKSLEKIHEPLAKEFASIIKKPAVSFGEFEHVVGNSGITQEDFDSLDDEKLLKTLRTYEPPSSLMSDREALGDNVAMAVKNNPDRFISLLPQIAKTQD